MEAHVWKFFRSFSFTLILAFFTATLTRSLLGNLSLEAKFLIGLLLVSLVGRGILLRPRRPDDLGQGGKNRSLGRNMLCSVVLSTLFLLMSRLMRHFDASITQWWLALLGTALLGGLIEWWFFKPSPQP